MKVRKIGYGRASVHDFESTDYREYCYIEADLEPWEDVDESLATLRQRVCSKVGIREDVQALELRQRSIREEIRQQEETVEMLRQKWESLKSLNRKIEEITLNPDFDPIPF
jgi:predicted RNase H-like nuclease (RuvC/YqgF family)